MPEYHGQIQNGKLTLSATQRESRQRWLISLKDGSLVKETITKMSHSKTHQQIKTIFGLVIATIIDGFDDLGWDSSIILNTKLPTGIGVTKGLLKEYFYVVCPIEDDEGNKITLSKANIMQAMKFIGDTRNWAASQWGMEIPDPNPDWREAKEKDGKN